MINFFKLINSAGGAERVFCNMANELVNRGHMVTGVCSEQAVGRPFYHLDERVNFYNLEKEGVKIAVPAWRKLVRESLRLFSLNGVGDPYNSYIYRELALRMSKIIEYQGMDIIVCYDIASHQLVMSMNIKVPVILMLHISAETLWYAKRSKRHCREIIKALASERNCIQVLLPQDKTFLLNKIKCKIVVIPNAVEQHKVDKDEYLHREKSIVCVGRLEKTEKRQHILIEAFAQIAKSFPEWQLYIYGAEYTKGYVREMREKIKQYGLTDRILLMGVTADSIGVLRKASIFAFPSAREGFGLALTEAMSVGLPSVAFRSCLAVKQIIEHEKTGLLCADGTGEFSYALSRLMSDEKLRIELGRNAHQAIEIYAPGKIWDQWEKLFAERLLLSK